MDMEKAKVIVVTSVKGGVGKTTTVLNLAGIYSSIGKKVLIIDLDLYSSSVTTMLNLDAVNDIYGMTDDMNNNRYNDFEYYVTKYNDNIDVISGPKDIRTSGKMNALYIPVILSKSSLKYDVVLVDTNHFLNDINAAAIENASDILYVITNDAVDMKNMRSMVSIYKNLGVTNYKILLNESIFKGRHKYSKYDIENFLKHEIDFHLSDKFNIRTIDNYVMEGKILTTDAKVKATYKKSISDIKYMADVLISNQE